ncbi:Acyl-CoA dehydrogenase [Streptosporangium subroseum]|uniref:Acyl-CoA dehydrogenase n=1 Tax=Streptosporangium subroseum TaxID=106412 RepID=A0A239FZM6_9ACTN|nr:acyl-CoA dehydrogenase family protein [Streptosporangium subroseum]SNS62497.1 Acyl-CoA dehydrogenase [Streptosporangium subroseum]
MDLDTLLGDPADPDTLFSYARCAELDRREEFPEEICRELDRLGLPARYVPAEHGGTLTDYPELLDLIRTIARRDLTVAVGHAKSYLGSVSVWVAGGRAQAGAVAADVIAGVPASWGLTERTHGSDLLAGEVRATPVPGGYRVTGEKWLINNATRGSLLSLLARTDPDGGPRGFSLLLIDKRELDGADYTCLPKVPTHGIRGADISGIAFHDAPVPESALIGPEGGGLEVVLKALQLTRTICAGLSLGAADQAIRQAEGFTAERRLYGRLLSEMPHVRRTLGEAHAARFVAEAVTTVAARGIHALPSEMSVISAVTKAFVPARVDELIFACGELLGTRAFLTEVHDHGVFQKLARDHRVVSIFDGNSFVNENALINQFPVLARGYRSGPADGPGLSRLLDLSAAVGGPDHSGFTLVSRGGCGLVQGLQAAVDGLSAPDAERARQRQDLGTVEARARELLAHCDDLHAELAAYAPNPREVPPEAFVLAQRYEWCFAGAAVLQLWLANPGWKDQVWPEAALTYVLARLGSNPDRAIFDRLFDETRERA